MENILIHNGMPRRTGSTEYLLDAIAKQGNCYFVIRGNTLDMRKRLMRKLPKDETVESMNIKIIELTEFNRQAHKLEVKPVIYDISAMFPNN